MFTYCPTFMVFATEECDGRDFDFTLAAEQLFMGLLPQVIFIFAGMIRLVFLIPREDVADTSATQMLKFVSAPIYSMLQFTLLMVWSLLKVHRTIFSLAVETLEMAVACFIPLLVFLEGFKSARPSTLNCLYFGITAVFDFAQVRSMLITGYDPAFTYVVMARIVCKLWMFSLECVSKRGALREEFKHIPPEATAGIVSRSFQFWMVELFTKGFRGELKLDNLFLLDPDLKAETLGNRFKASWLSRSRPERRFEIIYASMRTFWSELAAAAVPRVFKIGFTFAQVFLISRVLTLLEEPLTPGNQIIGYLLIGAAAIIYLGLAITKLHYDQQMSRFTTKFRGAVVCAIYDHLTVLGDTDGNKEATLTLMSVDVDRIASALPELNEIWSQAIEVIIGITLLSLQLGWVSVMPVFLVVVAFLGGAQITRTIGDKQKIWIDAVQVRVTFTSAILAGMRNIKMLGLSSVVQAFAQQYRIDETIHMAAFRWSILWQNVVQNIPWALTPAFTFAIYAGQAVARGQESIDTVRVFSSLAIIHLLTDPTAKLVSCIPSVASTLGCFERIQTFLLTKAKTEQRNFHPRGSPSLNDDIRTYGPVLNWMETSHIQAPPIILADQLSIRPAPEADIQLSDISFTVPPNSFTAIVGPVGSGKTTLLKAILGELPIEQGGELRLAQCSASYCSQTPWLPNTTVRDAIIGFTTHSDNDDAEAIYEDVLVESALRHDIEQWENGDKTMTGANGSLLSGGQQHRIAIARALYILPTLIVLDDVFAALDVVTQRTIFNSLFRLRRVAPERTITVVFATSDVELLKYADQVLLIKDGTIEQVGAKERATLDFANHATAEQRQEAITTSPRVTSANDETLQQAREIDDLARSTGDLSVYKYYSRHVNKFHGIVFLAAAALNIFSYSFAQIWIKWWTDAGGAQIALYISVLIGLALLNSTSTGLYIWAMVIEIAPSTARKFHDILLRTVMRAPQALFAKTDNGVLLNRFTQDMSIIEGQLATGVLVSITNLFSALAAAALVATGSSYMALSIPALVLTIWGLQHVYVRTSRQLRILEIEYKSPLYTHFAETASGLMTIRIFGWEEPFQKKNVELLNQSQRSYYLLFCAQKWLGLVLDLIVAAEAVLVIGLAAGIRGSTSSGLLGVSLTNVLSFSAALSNFLGGWTMLETSLGSIARLKGFEETVKPEDQPGETHRPTVQWPAKGQVEFRNVTAQYDDTPSGLRDINLTIGEGQIVGICGRTGSGKSSLIATLLRLVEISSGTITIDGVDIATLPRQFLREQIIVATQHPLIMPATLRVNLDPERRRTDAEMIGMLDLLELTPLAQRLGGLSGEVRVDGLSKGEQLLISLARLVLSKRHEHGLLLLDEVTSSLDVDTETTVQRIIRQHFGLYTKIVVAHRLHTIIDSDLIVLMDDGQIAESGPPRKLIADTNSRFSKLLQSQL